MKNLGFAAAMFGLLLAAPAFAQRPNSVDSQRRFAPQLAPAISVAALNTAQSQTPPAEETWSYPTRESRAAEAAAGVYEKARFRSIQRRQRIATSRWYGYSKSRPTSVSTPWTGADRSVWASREWPRTAWRTFYIRPNGSIGR